MSNQQTSVWFTRWYFEALKCLRKDVQLDSTSKSFYTHYSLSCDPEDFLSFSTLFFMIIILLFWCLSRSSDLQRAKIWNSKNDFNFSLRNFAPSPHRVSVMRKCDVVNTKNMISKHVNRCVLSVMKVVVKFSRIFLFACRMSNKSGWLIENCWSGNKYQVEVWRFTGDLRNNSWLEQHILRESTWC